MSEQIDNFVIPGETLDNIVDNKRVVLGNGLRFVQNINVVILFFKGLQIGMDLKRMKFYIIIQAESLLEISSIVI